MGTYSLSSSRSAGEGRRQTRKRQAFQFPCPGEDAEGSPLQTQGSVPITGQNGASLTSCTYEAGGDPCLYSPDGSLEEGPSACLTTVWPTGSGFPCVFGPFGCGPFPTSTPVTSPTSVSSSRTSGTSRTTSTRDSTTSSPISSKTSDSTTSSTNPAGTSAVIQSAPSSSRNPLAIGSPGFIGVIVAGGLVLLVLGIVFGRRIRRHRSRLDMAGAARPSTAMAQTNDPEMQYAELRTHSQRSSDNEASTIQPPVRNARTNEPAMVESQFLDSAFGPANSGSATYPVANSRTRNDGGVQESQFLSEFPPQDRRQQAAAAAQPQGTGGAAPRISGAVLRPVGGELSSDSEPEGSTTYAGSSSDASTVEQRRSQYQPWGHPMAAGQETQNQQERERRMRMWSASVASERRASTPDSDSTTRYVTPDSTTRQAYN
ncbi:hypothetical protein FB451DRAFT_1242413 [Mycena latifolia]|nr:hypothetical protein FB451DRAFT_1242413 [Mycena latifolia]